MNLLLMRPSRRVRIELMPRLYSKLAARARPPQRWLQLTLLLAGLYNILWGGFAVFFPTVPFAWMGVAAPRYPELVQCIGMIVGVYGVGYAWAARDPHRHWPIVLVGLLGKVFGPIGFLISASQASLPWIAGWTIVTNDLIWWIPFGLILWRAAQYHAAMRSITKLA